MNKSQGLLIFFLLALVSLIFNSCKKDTNETDEFRIDENQTNWKKYIYSSREINTNINANTYGAYDLIGFNHFKNSSFVFFNRYLTTTQGCIASSTNGGTIWTVSLINNSKFDFVDFVNDSIGFAISTSLTGDYLLTTTNGGTTWQNNALSIPAEYPYAIDFLTEDLGYALNISGLYKTINAGQNWTKLHNTTNYEDLIFLSDSVGYAYNANALYKTNDSAETWSPQYSAPGSITHVFLKTDSIIFLGLKGGIIQKSSDAASNFSNASDYIYSLGNSDEVVFTDIHFFNNNIGFASISSEIAIEFPQDEIGIGAIIKTDDGGDNWYLNYRTQMIKIKGFYLLDDLNCFAYGRQESDQVFRQAYILKTTTLGN
jgi:hypothetical protein